MHNVVITDTMGDSGEIFIPGSFKLKKVTFDKYGNILHGEQNIEIGDKLKLGEGNKSFELKLGDIGTQQLYLEYDTTYTPGKTLKNSATLNSAEKTKNVSFSYRSAESGGTGSGDLASKIKLIKVDKENKQIKLANAVFTVTKPDGSTFELTTGADGTVASGVLEQGSYKVKEKTPPLGYLSSNEEYTLNVTPAGGAIQEIENKPIKIDVEGIKTWSDGDDQDGKRPVKITVNLLKNGAPFKTQEVREDADGNWKYSFKNLRKYENGQEIKYTVTENAVAGYSTEINGYDITNKYTPEKTSVTVTKSWNDSNDKDKIRPNSIKVQLYANGKKKGEVVELKKADQWTHTWRELPQKEKGKDIEYTVKEVGHISGYKVSVDDKDHGNIIITNTHTPKEEVSGPETGDGSNMKLYVGMLALSGMLLILVATKGSKLRNQK